MDEAAYQAHVESPHAKQYAWSEGISHLESRERFFYEILNSLNEEEEYHVIEN